jgi:hypothetical protein
LTEGLVFTIEQGVCDRSPSGSCTWIGRSPGFADELANAVEKLAVEFGGRPPGLACPEAVFARPIGTRHVAVARAYDHGPCLRFHVLLLERELYRHIPDPFAIVERFPAPTPAPRDLPSLEWPQEPLPARTIGNLQAVLKEGDGPLMLGAAQALVDGCRVVFERPSPDSNLVRSLWTMLPDSTRAESWPASFVFDTCEGFDLFVLPPSEGRTVKGYLTEEQCRDYPQGWYELNFQIAVEAGDQKAVEALLARRSSRDTIRLAGYIIGVMVLVGVVMKILTLLPQP